MAYRLCRIKLAAECVTSWNARPLAVFRPLFRSNLPRTPAPGRTSFNARSSARPQTDRATRRVSQNLANYCTTRTPVYRPFSRTTRVSRYHKGKTNLDLTEARDSECQWQQLGHMQVCTSFQTDNHAITPPLSFFTVPMLFRPPNQQRQSTEGKAITVQQCRNNLYNKSRTNRRNGVRRLESTNVHV